MRIPSLSAQQWYDAARGTGVMLWLISLSLTAIAQTPDTEVPRHVLAWFAVAQSVIAGAIMVLPRAQGDGRVRDDTRSR
jgi:hypothetical protein